MTFGLSRSREDLMAGKKEKGLFRVFAKWRRDTSRDPPATHSGSTASTSQHDTHVDPDILGRNANAVTSNKQAAEPSTSPTNLLTLQVPGAESMIPDVVIGSHDVDVAGPMDVWSVAYREAISELGEEVQTLVSKGDRLEDTLKGLQEANEEGVRDSLFLRGVMKVKGPLQHIKLALDLASPLTSFDPTIAASTASAVVKSVTAVAIGICGAEEDLKTQIFKMIEHIAVIDECDTLGQQLDEGNNIHNALVVVYKDLLGFYVTAIKIFNAKAFVIALVSEQLSRKLPPIVSEFLQHAALLRSRIENATLELVQDVKNLLQDNKIQKLLGADNEKRRSEFHSRNQRLRATKACEWVTRRPEFLHWYESSVSDHLILFGDMGSGKTVTTSYIIDELIRLNQHELPRPSICFHYCRDDVTGELLYVYSSLILQLLDQHEGLKVKFDKWYDKTREEQRLDPTQSARELGNFFSTCVENLHRPLFVVVDGLDECDNESRADLVAHLRELSQRTPRLKVLFSSRAPDEIRTLLCGMTRIYLEFDQERDETIVSHMVGKSLQNIPQETRSVVIQALSQKARGSAIWVRLTVDHLEKRKITKSNKMITFLQEIPPPDELSKVYARLFSQATGDDPENRLLATKALEILAVARRPMSILELGWAVALDSPEATTLEYIRDNVDEMQVFWLIQPFVTLVDSADKKKSQLRLSHQSLKELILRDAPENWNESKSRPLMDMKQRSAKFEAQLLGLSVKYLLFEELVLNELFSTEQQTAQVLEELPGMGVFDDSDENTSSLQSDVAPGDQAPEDSDESTHFDPADRGFGEFFVYASCFWLGHFKAASSESLPMLPDIVELCKAKSQRLKNWVTQYCRPDCTITPKFVWDSEYLDPLLVVSLYGPEVALQELLKAYDTTVPGDYFITWSIYHAVEQNISYGHSSQLSLLFRDPKVGPEVRSVNFVEKAMRHWAQSSGDVRNLWEGYLDLVFGMLVQDKLYNELLCAACRAGCLPIIERLFREATGNPELKSELLRARQDTKDPSKPERQSIGEAVWNNHTNIVRFLLKQEGIESHFRHLDSEGSNVLHLASRYCNPEVFTLLTPHFKEGVNEMNENGDTPLDLLVFQSTSTSGRLESTKVLLDLGKPDVRGGHTDDPSGWYEPLQMAARRGDHDMCRLLVEHGGAEPLRALRIGDDGRCSLSVEFDSGVSEEQQSETIRLLCSLSKTDFK